MKNLEEVSTIMIEEMGELTQALCKAKRFGLHSEWNGVKNYEQLEQEIADVSVCLDLLINELCDSGWASKTVVDMKKQKKLDKLKIYSNLF